MSTIGRTAVCTCCRSGWHWNQLHAPLVSVSQQFETAVLSAALSIAILRVLQDIAVPLLCLGDHDDPLLSQDLLRASLDAGKLNRHIITALTRNGGHLGWIEGWKGKPWMSGAVSEYIHAVLENSERPQGAAAGPPLKVVDPLPVVVSLELTESDPPKVVLNLKASPGMAESTERTAPCLQPDISALKDAATLEAQINQM